MFFFEKKNPKTFVLFAVVAGALAACSPAGFLNATISREGLTVQHNIAYGPDARNQLDVYKPVNAANLPVIVFLYGGSWDSGSKDLYPFVAATLARKGNVVVVPDYRLYPQVSYPSFLEDCARAVAWTQSHLSDLGGDPHRVFLMGHSAGAYNAIMLAVNPKYLADAGTSRDLLAGAIGLAGPYDFLPITGPTIRKIFAPGDNGPATQPITYVDGHAPPLLLVAGSDDDTVRPENTKSLTARVAGAGGKVTSRIYPGVGHIGLVLSIAPWFQGRAPVLADVESFVADNRRR